MSDNDGRKPAAHLPTIDVTAMADPVVQVIDEATGQIVYTLRVKGTSFRPKVYGHGAYTIKVGELGTDRVKVMKGVRPTTDGNATIKVAF